MGDADHCSARLTRVIEGRDQGNETGILYPKPARNQPSPRQRVLYPVRARPARQMRQAGQVADLAWRGLA